MKPTFANEFSRPIVLLQIGDRESRHKIDARPDELKALAKRLGLARLDELEGEVALRRVRGGSALSASGRVHAEAVQTCVTTLEPLPVTVDEDFSEVFKLSGTGPNVAEQEVDFSLNEELEPPGPELFSAGSFDLGEFLVQLLAERLDPYPRSPEAPSAEGEWVGAEDQTQANTFAELARKLNRQ